MSFLEHYSFVFKFNQIVDFSSFYTYIWIVPSSNHRIFSSLHIRRRTSPICKSFSICEFSTWGVSNKQIFSCRGVKSIKRCQCCIARRPNTTVMKVHVVNHLLGLQKTLSNTTMPCRHCSRMINSSCFRARNVWTTMDDVSFVLWAAEQDQWMRSVEKRRIAKKDNIGESLTH